jgi:tRNA A-37 threonylcarbamoyl transferase component Bud32
METEIDIEEFDSLRQYLIERGHIKPDESISFKRLLGGVSNRTVRVGWPDGHGWVLKQALAKLRVDVDWFSDPERIGVEAKATRWLNVLAPKDTTPLFVFEDMANHLMAMEAIPEESENWKAVLLSGRIVSNHFEQFGQLLGTIHRRSSEAGSEISRVFGDTTYFKSLRLDPYYLYAAEKAPIAAGFLNALVEETMHHRNSLVHGDFSPKNTLIYRDKLILLDYEVVHFGDPGFDVGFALTHFLSKANHLQSERRCIGAAAALFWNVYRREVDPLEWSHTLELRAVHHTLACLLARVIGKSPLEYLTPLEATRQLEVVLQLIAKPPAGVNDLIAEFIRKMEAYA